MTFKRWPTDKHHTAQKHALNVLIQNLYLTVQLTRLKQINYTAQC